MAHAQRSYPSRDQAADNADSPDSTTLPPFRKLSSLLPKPTRGLSLPALTDIISFDERAGAPARNHSLPNPPEFFIPGVSVPYLDDRPLKQYFIEGKSYIMQKPENENHNEYIRTTVGGRRLKYELQVIQNPKKARACGNGPKAPSDRRPVDPPPVITLKVYDITDGTHQDITMSYESGFMLYASLELSRPLANGRMHAPNHYPVLTGVCVANCGYYDKPQANTGYFVFTDISVRHEGWYHFRFSLFEKVKHAQDADPDISLVDGADHRPNDHEAMANRMDVASESFQVFSAKKFPGLQESTSVSRTLAEQGVRVRIRRDIRQRKSAGSAKPKSDSAGTPRPDIYPMHDQARTASMDSQLNDPRRYSSDTYASRPAPSRQLSIASSIHPSPTTPAASHTRMGPPMYRPGYDSSSTTNYSPTQYQSSAWPSSSRPSLPSMTLAPILNPQPDPGRPEGGYHLPESKPTKRSHSPQYNQTDALKHGARPDDHRPWQAPVGPIEPDDSHQNDDELYNDIYSFRRSEDGGLGRKNFPPYLQRR